MAVSYGPMPFGGIYDITSEVLLAQKNAVLNPNELLKVASQAYGIKQINDYTSACKCEKEEIGNLVNSLVSFEKTSSAIYKCINNLKKESISNFQLERKLELCKVVLHLNIINLSKRTALSFRIA